MKIISVPGFSSVPPEPINGSSRWIFIKHPSYTDAHDILTEQLDYQGTELHLFDLETKKVYQPFKKEPMIYLENPVYDPASDSFGVLRFDFLKQIIQLYQYRPLEDTLTLLATLPFDEAGDLINVRILISPFTLVKHEIHDHRANILWPTKETCQWEENECLEFLDETYFYTSKWVEEPYYYEEVIMRRRSTRQIDTRQKGQMSLLPNGEIWHFVE